MRERILSALILAPLLILAVALGPREVLLGILVLVAILALRELLMMTTGGSPWIPVLLGALPLLGAWYGPSALLLGSAMALLGSCLYSFCRSELQVGFKTFVLSGFGLLYISLPLAFLLMIRDLPDGPKWLLALVLGIWCGDSAALFAGRIWGRRALAPRISPKKTVEGALATFVGVAFGFSLVKVLLLPGGETWRILLAILGVGFLSQVGDLSESLIKRASGVKDSGRLIPGHGGMLDRIDSFLFASPFLYYLLRLP